MISFCMQGSMSCTTCKLNVRQECYKMGRTILQTDGDEEEEEGRGEEEEEKGAVEEQRKKEQVGKCLIMLESNSVSVQLT